MTKIHTGGHSGPKSKRPPKWVSIPDTRVDLKEIAVDINGLIQNGTSYPQQVIRDGEWRLRAEAGKNEHIENNHGTSLNVEFLDFTGKPVDDFVAARRERPVTTLNGSGKPVEVMEPDLEDPEPPQYLQARITVRHNNKPVRGLDFTYDTKGKKGIKLTTNAEGELRIDNLMAGQSINLHCPIPKERKLLPERAIYPSTNGRSKS